jgi:hypothetical protein
MRFIMLVKTDEKKQSGPPSPELMAAIGKLTEEMTRAGVVLETGGLLPSTKGAKLRLGRGKITVTDGPFTESKELIGGYAILRADSKKEAIEHGRRFMQAHADTLGPSYEAEVEIRQLMDFGPEQG